MENCIALIYVCVCFFFVYVYVASKMYGYIAFHLAKRTVLWLFEPFVLAVLVAVVGVAFAIVVAIVAVVAVAVEVAVAHSLAMAKIKESTVRRVFITLLLQHTKWAAIDR